MLETNRAQFDETDCNPDKALESKNAGFADLFMMYRATILKTMTRSDPQRLTWFA